MINADDANTVRMATIVMGNSGIGVEETDNSVGAARTLDSIKFTSTDISAFTCTDLVTM